MGLCLWKGDDKTLFRARGMEWDFGYGRERTKLYSGPGEWTLVNKGQVTNNSLSNGTLAMEGG